MKLQISFIVLAVVYLLSPSCQRKRDAIVIVSCKDSLGVARPDVTIRLYAYSTGTDAVPVTATDLKAEGVTDKSGQIDFTFKLPGMYKVVATSGSSTGSGIIKSQEGKGVAVKFVIK